MKYASEKIFYTPKADDLKTSHRLLSSDEKDFFINSFNLSIISLQFKFFLRHPQNHSFP